MRKVLYYSYEFYKSRSTTAKKDNSNQDILFKAHYVGSLEGDADD